MKAKFIPPFIIHESQIKDGVITSAKIANLDADKITAGQGIVNDLYVKSALTIASGGCIKEGQTAFNTGIGFWLGDVNGTPKFSIGNPNGYHLNFDGENVDIQARFSNIRTFEAIVDAAGHGDFTDIQSALNAGKKRIYVRGGTYTISSTITISSSDVLIQGEGMNSTIIKIANGANINAITIKSGLSNIVIANIQIDGNKANQTSGNGILINGTDTANVTNCAILNCYLHDIYGVGIRGYYTKNCIISECIIANCGFYGIYFGYSSYFTLSGNQIIGTVKYDAVRFDKSHYILFLMFEVYHKQDSLFRLLFLLSGTFPLDLFYKRFLQIVLQVVVQMLYLLHCL